MSRRGIMYYFLIGSLAVSGCASSPEPHFYTLANHFSKINSVTFPNILIDMPVVIVPERLARPQLVIRDSGERISILEQDRWSVPFDVELRDALSSQIASQLGALDVTHTDRPDHYPVYHIAAELRQWSAIPNNQVKAVLAWDVTQPDKNVSVVCQLSLTEPVGAGVDNLVKGMQHLVSEMANAVAKTVRLGRDGCSHG